MERISNIVASKVIKEIINKQETIQDRELIMREIIDLLIASHQDMTYLMIRRGWIHIEHVVTRSESEHHIFSEILFRSEIKSEAQSVYEQAQELYPDHSIKLTSKIITS